MTSVYDAVCITVLCTYTKQQLREDVGLLGCDCPVQRNLKPIFPIWTDLLTLRFPAGPCATRDCRFIALIASAKNPSAETFENERGWRDWTSNSALGYLHC